MIERSLAAFFQEGLSIHIGTRNERLEPNGAKAIAAIVDDDGVHMDVYVPKVAAARLLPDLEANGQAAVVLCRPTDDRACQVKGVFAGVRPARASERAEVVRQSTQYREYLQRIGIPHELTGSLVIWPALVVRLKTTSVFDQTPGPKAGQQMS